MHADRAPALGVLVMSADGQRGGDDEAHLVWQNPALVLERGEFLGVENAAADFGREVAVAEAGVAGEENGELMTVAIRAKEPEGTESRLYEYPVAADSYAGELNDTMKFAAAVAEAAMILRESEWKGTATYDSALELLRGCGSVSGDVYREEFVYLMNLLNRGQ